MLVAFTAPPGVARTPLRGPVIIATAEPEAEGAGAVTVAEEAAVPAAVMTEDLTAASFGMLRQPVNVNPAAEPLAKALNPVIGYWDPLGLGSASFWDKGNEFTWGWLRHAEIKHGRVAMAAFVGFWVQEKGGHFPQFVDAAALPEPLRGWEAMYAPGLTPPEQWDATPLNIRWQIIAFVGFLEFWSELAPAAHYTKGGKPGYFPPFNDEELGEKSRIGNGLGWPNPVPALNLFQPFGSTQPILGTGFNGLIGKQTGEPTAEAKERGLLVEINNGRLAMIGIMGFLAEEKVPGAVPALAGLIKPYAGQVMDPFTQL